VVIGCAACWSIVIAFFFIIVGFFIWSDRHGTSNLILFSSILLCIFVPLFMIAAYLGSSNKMEIEGRLIRKALDRIIEKKNTKRVQGEANINNTLITLNEQ